MKWSRLFTRTAKELLYGLRSRSHFSWRFEAGRGYPLCQPAHGRHLLGGCAVLREVLRPARTYLETNLELWRSDPDFFEREVTIAAFPSRFFRWHSSGDIPDMAYLEMMARVAVKLPDTRFLAFTKKYELIDSYIDAHGSLPENLVIVLSAWGGFKPDNPHNLPVAYIRFRHESADIPADARPCPSYCGECVATGMSCWDLKRGESVVFYEH